MGYSAFAMQKAVDAALLGDDTLMGMVSSVVNNPEQEEDIEFPFVVIGTHETREFGSKSFDGCEMVFSVHVFSRAGDNREAEMILGELYRILHRAELEADGHQVVDVRFEASQGVKRVKENDFSLCHGVMRFAATTVALVS